jgi:hypothetical protein
MTIRRFPVPACALLRSAAGDVRRRGAGAAGFAVAFSATAAVRSTLAFGAGAGFAAGAAFAAGTFAPALAAGTFAPDVFAITAGFAGARRSGTLASAGFSAGGAVRGFAAGGFAGLPEGCFTSSGAAAGIAGAVSAGVVRRGVFDGTVELTSRFGAGGCGGVGADDVEEVF